MKLRGAFVWLHRWVGLLMAGFLILVGLTGSLLAFNVELERVFAPQLFAKPRPGSAPLDLATLAERAQEQLPQAQVTSVTYQEPDQVSVGFAPRNGTDGRAGPELAFDEFYVDPWTGDELGRRKRGDLSQGLINLMPFIYDLHWRLALGDLGQWTLGIVAVLWTIDCFVGFYLTLPPGSKDFWRRWKPAWLIKRNASAYRLNFDLHRAGGLWFWVVLFVFAWSSVMMDIRPAYEWVMRGLFDYHDSPIDDLIMNANATPHDPKIGWREALTRGERLMAEEAKTRRFVAGAPLSLGLLSAGQSLPLRRARQPRPVRALSERRRDLCRLRRRQRRSRRAVAADRRAPRQHDRKLALCVAHGARFWHALSHPGLHAGHCDLHAFGHGYLHLVEKARRPSAQQQAAGRRRKRVTRSGSL